MNTLNLVLIPADGQGGFENFTKLSSEYFAVCKVLSQHELRFFQYRFALKSFVFLYLEDLFSNQSGRSLCTLREERHRKLKEIDNSSDSGGVRRQKIRYYYTFPAIGGTERVGVSKTLKTGIQEEGKNTENTKKDEKRNR